MNFATFKKKFEKDPVIIVPHNVPSEPSVSVCIQTYNQELFIKQCVDSILIQKTDFPFEILLADDGSNDETRNICMEYARNHPKKIRLFLHSRENNIQVLGKNSANFISLYNFFSANGKYIAICEGDDYWGDPQKLQKQHDFMSDHPNYSICYHDFKPINFEGHQLNTNKVSPLHTDLTLRELLFPWIHPATLTVFFKNIFEDIPEETAEVLTLDSFLYSILGNYGPGKFLAKIDPSYYRIQENSIWGSRKLEYKLINKIHTYSKIAKAYNRSNQKNIAKIFQKRRIKLKTYLLFYYLKSFQLLKAFKFLF